MNEIDWLTLLKASLPMHPRFLEELQRQASQSARLLAGVDLSSGQYALMPPDEDFSVDFRQTVAPDGDTETLGFVSGDLVGPDAEGYPAVLAWRSRTHPSTRITPDMDPASEGPLEFFWMEFPIAELAGQRASSQAANGLLASFSFAVERTIQTWPDVWLNIQGKVPFTPDDVDAIASNLDGTLEHWNTTHDSKIHYRSKPEILPDCNRLVIHIDFGTAGEDALESLLSALNNSTIATVIERCIVGNHLFK